jgi:hypothetical protein
LVRGTPRNEWNDSERGREELTGLLSQTAKELLGEGISHIALFIPDDHEPTAWPAELAEAANTYADCAPVLESSAPPRDRCTSITFCSDTDVCADQFQMSGGDIDRSGCDSLNGDDGFG